MSGAFSIASIGIGAVLGALLRWGCGMLMNPLFPTLPMGTLFVNLAGSFLMGMMVLLAVEHTYFSYEMRLAVITGFLGSLTTFSTFSAEAFTLLLRQEFLWFLALGFLHTGGSIAMVFAGYALGKLLF